jgi:hypothetical protein
MLKKSAESKQSSVLEIARAYVAAGISVAPIRRDGTKAASVKWAKYQEELPTDAELRGWFGENNPAGLAIIGGAVSGALEILDFDREAGTVFPAWQQLTESDCPGLIDRLSVVETPANGYHVRYRCPDLDIPGNTVLALDPAIKGKNRVIIETRGEGGYVLVPGCPPGCHETGRLYEQHSGPMIPPSLTTDERETLWTCARSFNRDLKQPPRMTGAGDLRPGDDFDRRGPDWSEILEPQGWRCVYGSAGGERRWRRPGKDRGWSATTGKCQGNDGADLFRVFSTDAAPFQGGLCYGRFRAYALLNHGNDLSAAADALGRLGYGTPSRKTAPAPRQAPLIARPLISYQPFPTQLLPAVVRGYVGGTAAALGCDPGLVALPVLAVVASVIGDTRRIRLKRGWEEPAVLWTATIADSGAFKSPAWSKATGRLFSLQHSYFDHFKKDRAAHAEALEKWKEEKKEAKKKADSDPGERPEPPILRRVVCQDTTVEKLAEILEDNPRGLLVTRDELNAWIGSFTRYKGKQGGSDVPNWLEMSRAGPIVVDRKTGERRTLYVERAAVSVTGGIQPGILARAMTGDLIDAGFLARLLLCMPPQMPKQWLEAELDPDTERMFDDLLSTLLKLDFDKNSENRCVPKVLRLSPAAKEIWVTWYNAWAKEQAAVEGSLAAAYSKLEAYSARFALLHYVAEHPETAEGEIRGEDMEAGINLARWFSAEVRRVYAMLAETPEERNCRRLVEFIGSRPRQEITAAALSRSNPHRYPDSAAARRALEVLAQGRLGEWVPQPAGRKGGRPSEAFRLLRRAYETYETYETLQGDDVSLNGYAD